MEKLPSLKAIRSFAAAARHENFTMAAEELSVTPGAISRMVQALEEELGIPLFLRNGRNLKLTTAGRSLYRDVSAGLDRIALGSARVRRSAQAESLSLVVSSGFATRWLVPRLPEFRKAYPHIRVDNIMASGAGQNDLSDNSEVAVRYGAPPWTGYAATRLALGRTLSVVCAPSLPGLDTLKEPRDLVGQRLLTYTGDRDPWGDFFAHYGLPMPNLGDAPRFHQLTMLSEAAVSGLGLALMPLFLVRQELDTGRLVQPLPHTVDTHRGYFILHRPGANHDAKVQLFKQWLVARARQPG